MNYNGPLYNNKTHAIKVRTGDDILNATKDAVCGELMVAKGGQFPGLYIATKTSGDDVELCRISETIPENKLPIDHDYSLKFVKGDYLELNSIVTMVGEFTLSYWFKPENEYEGAVVWATLGEYINHYGPRYGNRLTIRNMGDQSTPENSVIPGEWNHVFFTRDSNGITKMMLNAELVSQSANPHTGDISFANISLPNSAASYAGYIDEFTYWDSDQSENFSAIYNNGNPVDLNPYSPVHWWRMGDAEGGTGTTITDQGSGRNDLIIHGATFSKDTPYNSSSLQLSGTNNYLDTGSTFSDTFNKDFSISLWFKGATQIGENLHAYMAQRDDANPKEPVLWVMRINSLLHVRYRTDKTQLHDIQLSMAFPEDNEWHQLGVTFRQVDNEVQGILYLDGEFKLSAVIPMFMADYACPTNLTVGARNYLNSPPDSYLLGNLDEVSIFDRALSNTEMAAIYNNGVPTNLYRHNPLHWWRMGENATTVRELNNYGSSAVNGHYMSDDRTPEIEDGDLFFDGVNDVVGLPPNIFNLGSGNFAISIWFKIDTPGTYGLLSIGNSSGRVSTIIMSDTSIRTSAYSPAHNIDNDATVPQMATDTWHHFLWQKYGNSGGSQAKMYFNGVLVKDSILSNTTDFGADDLIYTGVGSSYEIASTIGFLAHWGGYYLDGGISEVAFWNNTLTDGGVAVGATAGGDIADIYNGGIVGKDISSYSPVHLWKPEREVITNKGRGDITPALVGPINYSLDTPNNTAPFSRYSLEFDGVDDSVNTGLSVTGKSELTVSAWVNMPTIKDSGFVQQYTSAGTGTRSFRVIHSHGKFWFQCYTVDGITEAEIDSSSAVPGEWFHLLGTFDGTKARIYLNNVAGTDGATLATTTLHNSSANVEIGGSSGLGMFTEGLIDEVAIWDVALANNERDYLYNNGKPGDISSLAPLGWWRMGDSDYVNSAVFGSTITDQGSGGNDGTISGATLSTNTLSSNLYFSFHSLRFDGVNGNMNTGTTLEPLIRNGEVSVSFWAKAEKLDGSTQALFSADNQTTSRIKVFLAGNKITSFMEANGDGGSDSVVDSSGTDYSKWFHVVCTYEENNGGIDNKLYINGSLVDTGTAASVSMDHYGDGGTTPTAFIGAQTSSGTLAFKGFMDEVAVFDYILTPTYVSRIYNYGIPRSLSIYSPVNWWRMGDSDVEDATIITDEGSGGNNGTISGATLSTSTPRT